MVAGWTDVCMPYMHTCLVGWLAGSRDGSMHAWLDVFHSYTLVGEKHRTGLKHMLKVHVLWPPLRRLALGSIAGEKDR